MRVKRKWREIKWRKSPHLRQERRFDLVETPSEDLYDGVLLGEIGNLKDK